MKGYRDEIVTEVRRNRAKLLEMYGGIEGLHKHMDEERPRLENEGWKFISAEEFGKRNNQPVKVVMETV
jgi:hypothetical protein